MSVTVTVAVPEVVLPLLSVAVSVTVRVPICSQSNVVGLTVKLAMPQSVSKLPLSNILAVIVTVPFAFNAAVAFFKSNCGGVLSVATIWALKFLVHPLASVTVQVKLPAPKPEMVAPVLPFDQVYVSGAVPPVVFIVTVPVCELAHGTSVFETNVSAIGCGAVICVESTTEQP